MHWNHPLDTMKGLFSFARASILVLTLLAGGQNISMAQTGDVAAPMFSLFLIGDAGEPDVGATDNIKLLKKQLDQAGEKSAVVFLGDNIYPKGMPHPDHKTRASK